MISVNDAKGWFMDVHIAMALRAIRHYDRTQISIQSVAANSSSILSLVKAPFVP